MSERYMRAYYHEFTPTGCDPVDGVLEAIARAGKSYHHTEQWDEAEQYGPRGYWGLIQQRANEAAESHAALTRQLAERDERLGHIHSILSDKKESGADLLLGSTSFKSAMRWSAPLPQPPEPAGEGKP